MSAELIQASEHDHHYMFARQVKFSANRRLAVERSEHFTNPKQIPDDNIWMRKPPDFSVKQYRSLMLPRRSNEFDIQEKKNITEDTKQWNKQDMIPGAWNPGQLPAIRPRKFLTKFKHIGPFEASLMCVKEGIYPKDKYQNPKPHDFRQYETGIQDFATSYSRDPFNLKFKSRCLNSLCELPPAEERQKRGRVKHFVLHKPEEPAWDSKLILPKSPWPPKSASYTRHRRRRGVYSAFMDRIEEKFTASNQKNLSLSRELARN
ncbi:PREDICTED: uncharacterized protein LOC108799240 [Nanorana parkeri]|uniref:uncharacterized protein LOC108799240 n=1 Tax=Nanorana parkeri TaxID=125878 RepID=UPI000854A5DA|nr:PREDICTED: uncharacterized protein LOC108799240 [Nanorana parkeri]